VLTGVVTAIGFTTISPLASVAVKVLLLVLVVVVVSVVVVSDVGFTGPVPETELELVADVVAVESVVPAEESLRVDVMADETLDDSGPVEETTVDEDEAAVVVSEEASVSVVVATNTPKSLPEPIVVDWNVVVPVVRPVEVPVVVVPVVTVPVVPPVVEVVVVESETTTGLTGPEAEFVVVVESNLRCSTCDIVTVQS